MTVRARVLRTVRAVVLALAVIGALAALNGCGAASSPSPPVGVDGLVIPTSDPDPSDFVGGVDNPWFPLPAGTTWTYAAVDAAGSHTLTVVAEPGPTIGGVATTARVSAEDGDRVVDWYAQDLDGNVWWFGREGEWQAGADGAEAGLAMAAAPRVGDGYRTGYAEGVVEDWVRVVSLVGDRLVAEQRTELDAAATTELSYERGSGPVGADVVVGERRTVRLVSMTP